MFLEKIIGMLTPKLKERGIPEFALDYKIERREG